jgi:dephospho-CoA kinase
MVIVGLTGSIGMGKSTAAKRFTDHGIPVFDADAEVHRLYEGAAVPAVEAAFPGTVVDGRVDRRRLGQAVIGDAQAMARLEAIIHPMVRRAEQAFLAYHAEQGAPMAVLEIPLLLETGTDALVDATVVLSAPPEVQRERVLSRPGMTAAKLEGLLAQQWPDAKKRTHADFVVDTSRPVEDTARELDRIIELLKNKEGRALASWLDEGG